MQPLQELAKRKRLPIKKAKRIETKSKKKLQHKVQEAKQDVIQDKAYLVACKFLEEDAAKKKQMGKKGSKTH